MPNPASPARSDVFRLPEKPQTRLSREEFLDRLDAIYAPTKTRAETEASAVPDAVLALPRDDWGPRDNGLDWPAAEWE